MTIIDLRIDFYYCQAFVGVPTLVESEDKNCRKYDNSP
ncbi:hypothetical protein LEP1GSC191_3853 [Leptospira borgpetersenii serovar Mini str. 201000851]|uniref:Uncharacterized protein n=2 Tax=Leptospira borgpetersenii TaxID=174 RepID=M3HW49_LEPBO|nr:hypothetical protein LEP1GSC128_0051 [Leptospira borgpetersenii str. 200801926]EMG02286.1 hypothetical protein LEP1GSC123_0870 [Leptospira borgpetersenii str. 200701203]EMK08980.1 hypothetical protein LEP1GSC066_1111 [Leptospira sp. serovar Kenya str. Sh9]ENO62526.1 hypothetical protein LEP1GSC191_3853 [Leptospira borgpetersenii serovar Mini str. 201000851]